MRFRFLFLLFLVFNVAYASLDLPCLGEKAVSVSASDSSKSHCDEHATSQESDGHDDDCDNHCAKCATSYAFFDLRFEPNRKLSQKEIFLSYQFSYEISALADQFQPPKV